MKEKRNVSLDLIRILATFIILNFHYAALFSAEDSFFYGFACGDWGAGGVTIFFLMSGFLLKKSSEKQEGIKSFFKKKFLRLLPIFYLSFLIAYVIKSISLSNWLWGGDVWKLLFTAIGIDCYLGFYSIPTYAVVGEWFTFAIILLYLLFPILNYFMEKHFKKTNIIIFLLYISDLCVNFSHINNNAKLTNALAMFWIGMLFYKYRRKVFTKGNMLLALLAGVVILFLPLPFESHMPYGQMEGICIFLFLSVALKNIKVSKKTENKLAFLSSMSYPIYINHHFLLYTVNSIGLGLVANWSLKTGSLFYIVWLLVTWFWSLGIYYLEKWIRKKLKRR